jgi:hypothetical protein
MIGNVYPPTANDWAMGIGLGDWLHLGYAYPEPGFIASRYNPKGPGHCGIVDYDGWTIYKCEREWSRSKCQENVRWNCKIQRKMM